MKGIDPDDPWFEEVSQEKWIWMYQSWLRDLEEKHDMYKDYATYLGSFSNLEMAQKIVGGKKIETNDADFEESWKNVLKEDEKEETQLHRRRKVKK